VNAATWTVALAALGASALTGLASLGVVAYQEHHRAKAARKAEFAAAVAELLSRSTGITLRAGTLTLLMQQRSGLKESFDILLRQRKPVDHFKLHDWQARDWDGLISAQVHIWTFGDQEIIRLANNVVARCNDVLKASTVRPAASGPVEFVRQIILGQRWTPAMTAERESKVRALAEARKRLADLSRSRLGQTGVDVWAQDDPG
jgi:hypothetical protein